MGEDGHHKRKEAREIEIAASGVRVAAVLAAGVGGAPPGFAGHRARTRLITRYGVASRPGEFFTAARAARVHLPPAKAKGAAA